MTQITTHFQKSVGELADDLMDIVNRTGDHGTYGDEADGLDARQVRDLCDELVEISFALTDLSVQIQNLLF